MKCYHYCTKEFLQELIDKRVIYPKQAVNYTDVSNKIAEDYVKEYVFENKKINKGNGMFFCWSHPDYKGDIEYNDNGDYILLELYVPWQEAIKTNYENWCSLGMDLYEANGDYQLADKICREQYDIKDGLEGSYQAIFDTSDERDEIQYLLPYINSKWILQWYIVSNKYC